MINKSCKENLWLSEVLRVIILLLILMMITLVTGCSQKKTENEQVNLQEKSERSSANEGGKEDENVIEEFKSIVPSAKIIDYAVWCSQQTTPRPSLPLAVHIHLCVLRRGSPDLNGQNH